MHASNHELFFEVYESNRDAKGECLWQDPPKIRAMDCRDKKNMPDQIDIPESLKGTIRSRDRMPLCAFYKNGEACEWARKGFSGRRRGWFDAFHNCAATCKVCSNPLASQVAGCMALVEADARKNVPGLAPQPRKKPASPAQVDAVSDTFKLPFRAKDNLDPNKVNLSESNKSRLNSLLSSTIEKCGLQSTSGGNCASWCQNTCNIGGAGGAFCCQGGSLGGNSCHGCGFCQEFDLGSNLQRHGSEIMLQANDHSRLNANSLADVAGRQSPGGPGLVFALSIGGGTLVGVDASFGVGLGRGGPQLFYNVGAHFEDSLAGVSFTMAAYFAPRDWTCEFGYGLGASVSFEPLDAIALAAIPLGVGVVATPAAGFINLAIGPEVTFACDGVFTGCNTLCSVGIAVDIGPEVDPIVGIDVGFGGGLSCPVPCTDALCKEANGANNLLGRACR